MARCLPDASLTRAARGLSRGGVSLGHIWTRVPATKCCWATENAKNTEIRRVGLSQRSTAWALPGPRSNKRLLHVLRALRGETRRYHGNRRRILTKSTEDTEKYGEWRNAPLPWQCRPGGTCPPDPLGALGVRWPIKVCTPVPASECDQETAAGAAGRRHGVSRQSLADQERPRGRFQLSARGAPGWGNSSLNAAASAPTATAASSAVQTTPHTPMPIARMRVGSVVGAKSP